MKISSPLIQIYFLSTRPKDLLDISEKLPTLQTGIDCADKLLGPWHQYSWMGRHALCVMRQVYITSGLDCFLLDGEGMIGIQDVAEMVVFPFDDGLLTPQNSIWCSSLDSLRAGEFAESLGFVTFVRLNRGLLENQELWAKAGRRLGVPSPAELLQGTATALRRATTEGSWKDEMGQNLRLMLTAGTGDAEIVLIGAAKQRDTIDKLLYLLAKLGADSIGSALFGDVNSRLIPDSPAVAETVTELLLPMGLYATTLEEAKGENQPSENLWKRLSGCLKGEVRGQLWLKRGAGSMADMGEAVASTVDHGWQVLTALGSVDVLINSQGPRNLADLIWMLAKIDAAAAASVEFPRKLSFQLTFGEAWGQKALSGNVDLPSRKEIFGFSGDTGGLNLPGELTFETRETDIRIIREFVEELRSLHWREDLRVLERMAERGIAVRKHENLPAETRLMADRCLRRMSLAIQDVRKCESIVANWEEYEATQNDPQLKLAAEVALLRATTTRHYLVEAGMLFDRALAHHTRGTLSLLLQPAFQARGPEHFCCEVVLGAAMAAFPAAVVGKMIRWLEMDIDPADALDPGIQDTVRRLESVGSPILYASHDEDFRISPLLGIIRIPRWVLWYPTASSMLVHEVGHSLCDLAKMNFAARSLFEVLASPDMELQVNEMALGPWLKEEKSARWIRDHLEESCAEIVRWLSCYSPGDTRQFVCDSLDHLDGRAARLHPGKLHSLLQRLLTSVIGAEQIARGWKDGAKSLFLSTSDETHQRLSNLVFGLLGHMDHWCSQKTQRSQTVSRYLSRAVQAFSAELRAIVDSGDTAKLSCACGMGQFAAWLWLEPALLKTPEMMKKAWWRSARMVWRSILKATLEITDREMAGLIRIAESLAKGVVPNESTRFPERLPVMLARCCRAQAEFEREHGGQVMSRIPAHARFALSMYLYSTIITRKSSIA